MGEGLTTIETKNLIELEMVIQKHLSAFYEVGFALMQIRDNKLYRVTYRTFEQYCKDRWGFNRDYANKLIRASDTYSNLDTTVSIPERTIRPLTSLTPERQREVYQQAVETAPNGKVTSGWIKQVIKGDIKDEGDSYILMTLKEYWNKATKRDKKLFIEWAKGGPK
jgi:hypothetical protein